MLDMSTWRNSIKDGSCVQSDKLPKHLKKTPAYLDFSYLNHLNEQCVALKMGCIFPQAKPLDPNNGEVFLHEHCVQQQERRLKMHKMPGEIQCGCYECQLQPFPLFRDPTNQPSPAAVEPQVAPPNHSANDSPIQPARVSTNAPVPAATRRILSWDTNNCQLSTFAIISETFFS